MPRERVIIHIDFDCFYAQVELRQRPELRDRPFGVRQKTRLVTVNYVARREFGVGKMARVAEALARCPEMVVINGEDLTPYRRANRQVQAILRDSLACVPGVPVERLGLDEFFMDVTSVTQQMLHRADDGGGRWDLEWIAETLPALLDLVDALNPGSVASNTTPLEGNISEFDAGALLALWFRRQIKETLGYTCSAGIASNKLTAKLASGIRKPDDQTVLLRPDVDTHLCPLSIRKLTGLGSKTRQRLLEHLKRPEDPPLTVRELRTAMSLQDWRGLMGHQQGTVLHALSMGEDPSPVTHSGRVQQHSIEDSFNRCDAWTEVEQHLHTLVADLVRRLEEEEYDSDRGQWFRRGKALRLTVRLRQHVRTSWDDKRTSKTLPMPMGVYNTALSVDERVALIVPHLLKLLREWLPTKFDLSLLNVAAVGFPEEADRGNARLDTFFAPSTKRSATSEEAATKRKKHAGDPEEGSLFTCSECGVSLPPFCAAPHALFHQEV